LFLICAALPLYAADINDLTYDASGATVIITGCDTVASGALVIPETIEGKPVTRIGDQAFKNCSSLTRITLPNSVTSIGDQVNSEEVCIRRIGKPLPAGILPIGLWLCRSTPRTM
jgi:hypothetical protein